MARLRRRCSEIQAETARRQFCGQPVPYLDRMADLQMIELLAEEERLRRQAG